MRPHEVAVIGAGPRGTIMLERLIANVDEIAPRGPVVIHVVDPETPGAGRVWRTGQPRQLLMNTIAADVTVFTDDTVRCAGPLTPGPTQYRWALGVAEGRIDVEVDEETLAEARAMQPWSYASRAFQGRYLSWAFRVIVERAPARVRVVVHRDRAVGASDLADGRQRVRLEGSGPLVVDALVLACGHFDVGPTAGEREATAFAARHGLRYVASSSPGEVDLTGVAPGETMLLRGLGLNFFDHVALLTAGRGGRFEREGDTLRYRASGREPVICAGSRRGQPYTARAEVRQEIAPRYRPRFLTADVIARLRARASAGRTEFRRDLWPHIVKEAGWVYYRSLLAGDPEALAEFSAAYPALEPGSPEMDALIGRHVPDPSLRWDWDRVDRPYADRTFTGPEDHDRWVRAHIEDDVLASRLGPTGDARKATAAMMRDLRDEVRQVVSHRGLSGPSYRDDVEKWFSGLVNHFASGPPPVRVEELLALGDAGVVRFVGPHMRVAHDDAAGAFVASSPLIPGSEVRAGTLVEAHLPLTDVRRATDPLLADLMATGGVRPHRIPAGDGEPYETGGIDITEGEQRTVDRDGHAHRARFAYGPPVESVQWVTAIGARPQVNSRTLLQADAIARAALAVDTGVRAAPARPSAVAGG